MKKPEFFKTIPRKKESAYKPKKWDREQAVKLSNAVQRINNLSRKWNLNKWADHFRLLRVNDKIKKHRITKALEWYIQNIGKEYIPQAYSAFSFRQKFMKIELAKKRINCNPKKESDLFEKIKDNPISKEAEDILIVLRDYSWPKGTSIDLANTVNNSLKAYSEFLKLFRGLMYELHETKKDIEEKEIQCLIRFCEYLDGRLESPSYFIERWMMDINVRLNNWEDWSGELSSFEFQIKSKQFQRMGFSWAEDFCGDANRWKDFMEELEW